VGAQSRPRKVGESRKRVVGAPVGVPLNFANQLTIKVCLKPSLTVDLRRVLTRFDTLDA
jgi:hypothetical protein